MTRFASYWDLQHFILKNSCRQGSSTVPGPSYGMATTTYSYYVKAYSPNSLSAAPTSPQHSGTNDQVQGVDELDTVKSDGRYIYSVSGNNLTIVQAYPSSDAKLVSRINVNGILEGIFVDGNRIAVLTNDGYDSLYSGSTYFGTPCSSSGGSVAPSTMPVTRVTYPRQSVPLTSSIRVYDSSDHSNPLLKTTVTVNGTFVDARLIGDIMYMIANQAAYCCNPILLPVTSVNGQAFPTDASTVYHSDIQDALQSFTSIVGLNIAEANAKPIVSTYLIGTSSTIYVSLRNIYLTSPMGTGETAVHRVSLDGAKASYSGTGIVPGHVLNQFSMDEYNGYFRMATVNSGSWSGTSQQGTNVYVLDSSLKIQGRLEGLAPSESFYAARFLGDRAYLVTYLRMDPLFVIGLDQPSSPKLLGKLEIPGVSDYLQPYDETHLIGLGQSSTVVAWENAALSQGLKLSMFDVSNPAEPKEASKYLIGDRGSDSPALRDHKAVLFERSLNLLVMPVALAVRADNSTVTNWAMNTVVWQGAFVFHVTSNEVSFRGGITHLPKLTMPGYISNSYLVTRSLFIGNILYTISQQMIGMNSLTDLSDLGSVQLNA